MKHSRNRKLVKGPLQMRMATKFAGLTCIGFLLQGMVLGVLLVQSMSTLEHGRELGQMLPSLMGKMMAFSAVLLAVVFGSTILLTFRVAGPLYRLENYLKNVIAGKQIGPCKLRQGDELQFLCDAVNDATEPLRRRTVPQIALPGDSGAEGDQEQVEEALAEAVVASTEVDSRDSEAGEDTQRDAG